MKFTLGSLLLSISLFHMQAQEVEWSRPVGSGRPLQMTLGAKGGAYISFEGSSPYPGAENVYTSFNRFPGYLWHFNEAAEPEWTALLDAPLEINGLVGNNVLVAPATDGSVLVAGSYYREFTWNHPRAAISNWQATAGGTQPGYEPADAFLLRVGADGALLGAQTLGGQQYQFVTALAGSPTGDAVLAGSFRGWAEFGSILLNESGGGHWVTSVDSNGIPRWAKPLVFTNYIEGPVVATDSSGNIIVAGAFVGELTVENQHLTPIGGRDLYIAKFSPAGELLWLKQGEGDKNEAVTCITTDSAGNIFLSAGIWLSSDAAEVSFSPNIKINARDFLVKFDPDGNALWAIPEQLTSIAAAPDGSLYGLGLIAGSRSIGPFNFTSVGTWDSMVARFNPDGIVTWARSVPDSHAPRSVAVASDGAIYVCVEGGTSGGPTAYIARYSTRGPEILQQPTDTTVTLGDSAEITVVVGDTNVTFRWFRNGVPLDDSGRVTGSSSATLRIANASREDEGDYTVQIESEGGTALSSTARLHVLAPIQFTSIQQIESDLLRLTFEGRSDLSYRFEASYDLKLWSFVTNSGPNNFSKPGEIVVMDRVQNGTTERYYRAVSQ